MKRRVLRAGRNEDFEAALPFRRAAMPLLAPVATCIIGIPLLMKLISKSGEIEFSFVIAEAIAVVVAYISVSFLLLLEYLKWKDDKYFLADVPTVNGWQWVRMLWFSAAMPFMLASYFWTLRAKVHDLRTENQELRQFTELKDHFSECDLRDDSVDTTQGALRSFCFGYWREKITKDREQKWKPRAKELQELIPTYEKNLEEARKELQEVCNKIRKYPAGVIPDDFEQKKLIETFDRLYEIPEVLWIKSQEDALINVEIDVEITHQTDEQIHNLGIYTLSFGKNYYTCRCCFSGLNALGQAEFPEIDSDSFLSSIVRESLADSADDFLPETVVNFVEKMRWEKLHIIGEENLARYLLPVGAMKPENVKNFENAEEEKHG